MQDIILISGKPYAGDTKIKTASGTYTPTIVDLTGRDGHKRLAEIKQAVQNGNMSDFIELVFVPLYGTDDKEDRSQLARKVIEFEVHLCQQDQMSKTLLAATIIICNKILEPSILAQLWEEIKMIDIFQFAHDKGKDLGLREGKDLGLREGKDLGLVQGMKDALLDIMYATHGGFPAWMASTIQAISNFEVLKGLHIQAVLCKDMKSFEEKVKQVVDSPQCLAI